MLRGSLSNQVAPRIAVDAGCLVEAETRFLRKPKFRLKDGAQEWFEGIRDVNITVFTLECKGSEKLIETALEDLTRTFRHFSRLNEWRRWVQQSPSIVKAFVADPCLQGMGDTVVLFSGWNQRVQ